MGIAPDPGVPQHVVGIQITYDDAPVGKGKGCEGTGNGMEFHDVVIFIIYI
jgi:hypothetical protein